MHAIVRIRTCALRPIVGVVQGIKPTELQEGAKIRSGIDTNRSRAIPAATTRTPYIAVCPIHFEVAHLRVRTVRQIR